MNSVKKYNREQRWKWGVPLAVAILLILVLGSVVARAQDEQTCPVYHHEADWIRPEFDSTGIELQNSSTRGQLFCQVTYLDTRESTYISWNFTRAIQLYEGLDEPVYQDRITYLFLIDASDTYVLEATVSGRVFRLPSIDNFYYRVWDWGGTEIDYDGEPIIILYGANGRQYVWLPSGQLGLIVYDAASS